MERLEEMRSKVDAIITQNPDPERVREGFVHLYGVSQIAAQLSSRRGLPPDLALAAGMLHDIYYFRTGKESLHAVNSAEDARVLLHDCGMYTEDEQSLICSAIRHHSSKDTVHAPLDEVIKDADLLQRVLYNPSFFVPEKSKPRVEALLTEMHLPLRLHYHTLHADKGTKSPTRTALAALAEQLAATPLVGNDTLSGPSLWPILKHFPGTTPDVGMDWCAAFVFHCCQEVGFDLPIRFPDPVSLRFSAVQAWVEWAQMPAHQFWHAPGTGFVPHKGDIVIFNLLLDKKPHDHMGIVLGLDGRHLVTAEGNVHNRSGVFRRNSDTHTAGYIRIPEDYRFRTI